MEPPANGVRTLPLFNPSPIDLDGSRQVYSPGGYEWWHFDAEDETGRFRAVAIVFDGFAFDPEFVRRYRQFISDPTRTLPPMPAEYPATYLAVYEQGRLIGQGLSRTRRLQKRPDGTWLLQISGASCGDAPTRLDCELAFEPTTRSGQCYEADVVSRSVGKAEHRWTVCDPRCRVRGEIQIDHRRLPFTGTGYHDRSFGTAPPALSVRRWMRGRMLWPDAMVSFYYIRPRPRRFPDELHVVISDNQGTRELPMTVARAHWSRRTLLVMRYPSLVHLVSREPQQTELRLESPQVIDTGRFFVRAIYEAQFGSRRGTALCEIGYPGRRG